ncbi:(2Fe-2S)-binding protein [Acidobacteria bacterium ACD]|nr:MAG: (2Fe-2S)-binding protein [Acidobacteriota bacterium]MCE7959690.1 (2Fe-2S)-binding protein [Acidobacteria bacterium ACB2]MDL1949218.1 (2Fe-2S)-binding protein [Acidobacteria bacterium ACD]
MTEKRDETSGVSRRGFLEAVGTAAVGVAAATEALAEKAPPAKEASPPGEPVPLTLSVNGRTHRLLVEPRWTLVTVLRDRLGLTGTKPGCERGECGACTVLIDGVPRYSCLTLALEAEGKEVTTVEGLMKGEELGPVQQAFLEEDAFQCGYCTPGQVVAAEGLLREKGRPTIDEIRLGMSGNLCRCGTYVHIFRAVHKAAHLKATPGR